LVVSLSFELENSDFEAVFLTVPASTSGVGGSKGPRRRFKIKTGAPANGLARLFDFAPTDEIPEL
jgi:hypothetical protein